MSVTVYAPCPVPCGITGSKKIDITERHAGRMATTVIPFITICVVSKGYRLTG